MCVCVCVCVCVLQGCCVFQVNWFLNALFHDGDVWRTAVISFDKVLVHGYFYMAR